jgi:hypothetical protein
MLASSHKPPGVDARCEMSMKGQSLENPKRGVEASRAGAAGLWFSCKGLQAADERKLDQCSPRRAAAGGNNAMNDASSKRT